ncbi:hypothetical protein Tco_0557540, partial [Tanacetum coccineum]
VPTSLPLPSSPLPPLPASLFIPPPVDRRYEVGESLTAAPRLAAVQEIDTADIDDVIEDTQDRQT